MNDYDEKSLAFCGLEDFLAVVKAYRDFFRTIIPPATLRCSLLF